MPDFQAALGEALALAEAAVGAGAKVLFLPEYCGGLRSDGMRLVPPHAPQEEHDFLNGIRAFARAAGVWVNVGSVAVTGSAGKYWNRGFMVDDAGDIRGQYDKIHLFDVDLGAGKTYRESATVSPGSRAVVHDTPHVRIGHTICYDLRFPGLFRSLAQAGAEILACPAAFTATTGAAHWHALNRARAIENTRFVVSACAVGPIEGGGESYGHSLVVGPWGEVIADGGDIPGVLHARIDLDHLKARSGQVPSLQHDRPFTLSAQIQREVA